MYQKGITTDKKDNILPFKGNSSTSSIRMRRLRRLKKATKIINLSFERILELKINQIK